jgi:hypothetical protein
MFNKTTHTTHLGKWNKVNRFIIYFE